MKSRFSLSSLKTTILVATTVLPLGAAHAVEYSMLCTGYGSEYAYQASATNGKTEVKRTDGVGIFTKPCPVSLALANGVLTGYEVCSTEERYEKKFDMLIDHETNMSMPGEVIALKRMGIFEAQIWAISFNRKEVAIVNAYSDARTVGGVSFQHCQ